MSFPVAGSETWGFNNDDTEINDTIDPDCGFILGSKCGTAWQVNRTTLKIYYVEVRTKSWKVWFEKKIPHILLQTKDPNC